MASATSGASPGVSLERSVIDGYFSRQLKLRHLQLLVALADRQTVGKVAEALHVTQPAVSKMLNEMEKGSVCRCSSVMDAVSGPDLRRVPDPPRARTIAARPACQ